MWQVTIECMRVQTFLFAVPRLLDIIGANTLLGETLRCGLSSLAEGAGLPQGIRLPDCLPDARPDDPLVLVSSNCADLDDPASLYRKGILTRDGGHFRALFANEPDAEKFAEAASNRIRQQLPGLRFKVSRPKFLDDDSSPKSQHSSGLPSVKAKEEEVQAVQSSHLAGLPSLQICQESGRGIASMRRPYSDGVRHISKAAESRKQRGKAFREHAGQDAPRDIASLLARAFPLEKPPVYFDKLCAGKYLALIHADGNGIGVWSNQVRGDRPKDNSFQTYLDREARGEAFYHAMRLAVRKAVVAAVKEVFHPPEGDANSIYPYRLLMLGGDDLLLVCQAQKSLDFVRAYAHALADQPTLPTGFDEAGVAIGKAPLTVGVGVAIAKPSFPFHRLHQIAEELASSAKRLTRPANAPHASVVDWAICTEAWMDNVEEARSRDAVRYRRGDVTETLSLSGKPYFILDSTIQDRAEKPPSLESLLADAKLLQAMPRSQRRALVGELGRGRRHAELCLQELQWRSPQAWRALQSAELVKDGQPALWWRAGEGYATAYADLVEITELPKLKLGGEPVQDREPDKETEESEEDA